MAKFVLQNVRLFTGSADLTTVNNKIEVKVESDEQDATAFVPTGDAWAEKLAGIRSLSMNAEGQWEAGDLTKVDNVNSADHGTITPWTVCPAGAAVGSLAWLTGALRTTYQVGDAVGNVAPWSADAVGNWPLVRGVIAHPPGTARTATGTGTATLIAAVPAGQNLYVALHVQGVSGTAPSLTVNVQSDDTLGFASPTTVGAFTAANALGSQIMRFAGPITDTYFRVTWTISGTTPSFLFTSSLGIA